MIGLFLHDNVMEGEQNQNSKQLVVVVMEAQEHVQAPGRFSVWLSTSCV